MNSHQQIRNAIRVIANKIKFEQKQQLREETKLRKYIRKLLREIEEVSPHESTGVNVLEDLLKTIVPILEASYKRLTTDVSQRKSFRSHILRAVQNLLSTESIYFKHDRSGGNKETSKLEPKPMAEAKNEVEPSIEDDPAFIDIEKEKKEKEAKQTEPKPEDAFAPIAGEDPTGRGFALRAFQKIQKQILDSYSLLGKDEDREVFYDYLITNLKLYFDKFEDELQKNLEEPTTPEYEEEKKKKASMMGGSSEPEPAPEPSAEPETENEEEPLSIEPPTLKK